jgi:hypothetical protein
MSLNPVRLFCFATACLLPVAASAADGSIQPAHQRLDNARIFPYFAAGGGWESTVTLMNLFEEDIGYRVRFYTATGQPAQVTFRTNDGTMTTASEVQGELQDDNSDRIVIVDAGPLQVGWAELEYDGESRIAGVLTFRQRVSGRPDFESSVLLTRHDQTTLYMPFNNTQNFATTVAITNPSMDNATTVQLRVWDAEGSQLLTREIQIFPRTTVAFSLRDQYPELNGRSGQLRLDGSGDRLSAIGFLFNPAGAFSSLPVVYR